MDNRILRVNIVRNAPKVNISPCTDPPRYAPAMHIAASLSDMETTKEVIRQEARKAGCTIDESSWTEI